MPDLAGTKISFGEAPASSSQSGAALISLRRKSAPIGESAVGAQSQLSGTVVPASPSIAVTVRPRSLATKTVRPSDEKATADGEFKPGTSLRVAAPVTSRKTGQRAGVQHPAAS